MTSFHPSGAVLYERLVSRLRMRHLRLLVALEQCLTLGAAGAEVGMSQPAATQMLKEMESLLGAQLYERHSRGMRPTAVGQLLVAQARLILGSVRHVADATAAQLAGEGQPLAVGAIPAAVAGLLERRLDALRRLLPTMRLSVVEDSPDHVMALLGAGVIQVALVREPPAGAMEQFRFIALCDDRLAIVAAPSHPMARRRSVQLADLHRHAWSLPVATHPAGIAFQQACRDAGFTPQGSNIQSTSTALLCSVTADGQTLAAVPLSIASGLLRAGQLVEIAVRQTIALPPLGAMHAQTGILPAATALVNLLAARA